MKTAARLDPRNRRARSLVSAAAFAAALVCGLGIPLFYVAYEYQERGEILEFKAKLGAGRAAKYIYEHQKFWRYHGMRLAEIIELPQSDDEAVHQRLLDGDGLAVAETGPPVSTPVFRRAAPVYVNGERVGSLEAEISLAPLLQQAALAALASISISVGAFLAFRMFPLRALDRTILELQAHNRRFDAALANMSQGMCIFDADLRLAVCNARYRQMYRLSEAQASAGTTLRELLAHRVAQGTFPAGSDINVYVTEVMRDLARGSTWSKITELADGRFIAVANRSMPGGGWVATHDDITDLKQHERELHAQNMRFDTAVNNMSHGLCMFDGEQRLVVCNHKYAEIYGIPGELTRSGTPQEQILRHRQAAALLQPEAVGDMAEAARKNAPGIRVYELQDGRSILVKHQPMARGGWVATHEDITEQRRSEARIAYLAHHDALTDLPNRILLNEHLKQACAGIEEGKSVAVLCLDLDRFKEVNDTLGHAAGDALLRAVAERLRACVHEHDTVARIGGDEFAIVQTNAPQPNSATALAARVIEVLTKPFEIEGHQILIGTSVGISVAPDDTCNASDLLKNADLALYQVKGQGRGSYRFFELAMDAAMHERRQMEIDLRRALVDDAFELHFQPILNLEHDRVTEFEALVRWRHPAHGMIPPSVFIPLAEEIGLIGGIGQWVLDAACTEAAKWPQAISVSVNLSPVQFKKGDLVEVVARALAKSKLAPNRLELEITESVLLENTDEILATLSRLRNLGIRVAMDDFGIGFSSLSSLSRFHFNKIKIDKSFVHGLGKSDHSAAIIEAVATLGARLDMTTTAEGIETVDQLAWLRALGIIEVQGYLIGRPRPAGEIGAMVAEATELMTELVRSAA
jgi:diguanylate cyclase (GGDEF)-like protein